MYMTASATAMPRYSPTLGMNDNMLKSILGMQNSTITSRNILVAVYSFSSPALKNRNLAKRASTIASGNHHSHFAQHGASGLM